MKNQMTKVLIEYRGATWCFVERSGRTIPFDQAVVDATYTSRGRVEGYVISVHGLPEEEYALMTARTASAYGVKAAHSLGRGPTINRLRLMPNGTVESV